MAAAPSGNFIIESCENVTPFYLCSNEDRPRRTLFYDETGRTNGTLHVSKDSFTNLDDANGGKIDGIFVHVPKNGFQYVVTKECPVMRSSKYTWLFPNAEPEVEGQEENVSDEKATDAPSTKQDVGNYHCFGITFPSDVDPNVLETFEKELKGFCDYREATCEVLSKDALGSEIDGNSSVQELVAAASKLSKTLMSKTTDTINAELEKRPQLKEKVDKAKEAASKAKTKLVTKLKESKIQEKFLKATRRLSKEAKALKDDLKQGNTDSVAERFDKGTKSTVEFIQLVTRKGANQIQSVKTVLIQRMPEYDAKTDANNENNAIPAAADAANAANGANTAAADAGPTEKKVDDKIKQGLDKAKQSTAFVGQVGASVVKAVAIGAGHTVKSISKQVEKNEAIQKHVEANPITYGNLKVIGKKTLYSYVTIANELENAALYLFSESAHATADVVGAKHGQEVGQAAHDGADVAVNIVNIFRLDNELIYGTIAEATSDAPEAQQNSNSNGNNPYQRGNNVSNQGNQNSDVQAAVGQAVMSSLIQSNMQGGSMSGGSQYGK